MERTLTVVERRLVSEGTVLIDELRKFSKFGHIGAIRAVVSGACISTLCGPLTVSSPTSMQGSEQYVEACPSPC